MLANEITLSVDEENDGVSPVNHVFTRFSDYENRSLYVGPSHSLMARNTLGFYRSLPKVSGNFRGVAKTALKFTQDITVLAVDGVANLTSPMIADVNFSFPVGSTAAQQLLFRQKILAALDLDAIMVPLNGQQMV